MKQNGFQHYITTGGLTLPVAMLILLGGWVLSLYFSSPPLVASNTSSSLWKELATVIPSDPTLSLGINLLIYVAVGFLLIPFNNAIAVIRTRASIQTSFFFVWSAFLPILHPLRPDIAVTLLLLLSIFCFTAGYQAPKPTPYMYHAWLFLGLASCIMPEMLWLIPAYLIGAYLFQCLSVKSFIAGLLGLVFACIIFCVFAWSTQHTAFLGEYFDALLLLCTSYSLPTHSIWAIALMGIHGLFLLIAIFYYWVKRGQTKIKTRDFINFILMLELMIQLLMYAKPDTLYALLPVSLICLSLIQGHLMTTVYTRATNVYLLFIIFLTLILYGLILFKI